VGDTARTCLHPLLHDFCWDAHDRRRKARRHAAGERRKELPVVAHAPAGGPLDGLVHAHEYCRSRHDTRQVADQACVQGLAAARLQEGAQPAPRRHGLQPRLDRVQGVQRCKATQSVTACCSKSINRCLDGRLRMVHMRFSAPASTAAPAVAPAARFPNTTRHRGASTGGAAAPPADASVITGARARPRCAAFGLRRWMMRWPATDAKGRAAAVCWTALRTLTSGSAPSSAPVALSCRATHRRLAVRAMATPGRLTDVRRPLHKDDMG